MNQVPANIEIHFSNHGNALSIHNLVELNIMLLGIQSLLPEYDFEVEEIKKGSIVEILTGDIAGVFVLATILYRASKALLEIKKFDREIKKIEAETKKICIENNSKEGNTDAGNDKNLLAARNELHELVQILREHAIDTKDYENHSNSDQLMEKVKCIDARFHVERIVLQVSGEKTFHEKTPYELRGDA
jgi:hypothetical protein